jgi:hypothetical protein
VITQPLILFLFWAWAIFWIAVYVAVDGGV